MQQWFHICVLVASAQWTNMQKLSTIEIGLRRSKNILGHGSMMLDLSLDWRKIRNKQQNISNLGSLPCALPAKKERFKMFQENAPLQVACLH